MAFALLPQHLEQFLVAKRVRDGGSAELLSPDQFAPGLQAWLAGPLTREDMASAAARQLHARPRDCWFISRRACPRWTG